ncbi:DUF881 domain-containing protein [Cellulomonas edaphi]|uniref:DUF881 domain-containing protein n=1 Tax=Cellulomonas edaphi TaxID=3053468 RepID=A0ABT7S6B8_9CELL|nr:DUF881 domain-containing protein [Cellulomons edaphi]MDM7831155.1 DUF881 domain-containing protein [Cellulomons edaphi]
MTTPSDAHDELAGPADGPEPQQPVAEPDAHPAGGDHEDAAGSATAPELHEEEATAPEPPATPQPSPSGWAALARALRFRASRGQLLAGVLCAVLGFALVVQVRQNNETSLSGLSQADLVRILDETTTRGDALATEVNDLRSERDQLLSGSDKRQAALDALRRSAETQGILTGRLPAEGPGVVVTLTEPNGQIKPVTMLNMLEELRNAGAEAIDLNGNRVTASSAFAGVPGAVTLDGVTLEKPYVWTAIGDPDTISTALQIPGGAMAAVRSNGGEGVLQRRDLVEVTSIRTLPDPQYATPVPAAAG